MKLCMGKEQLGLHLEPLQPLAKGTLSSGGDLLKGPLAPCLQEVPASIPAAGCTMAQLVGAPLSWCHCLSECCDCGKVLNCSSLG